MRTGTADLPLHGGRCPAWLFPRMARLGAAIGQAIVEDRGAPALLERLSDPFWFQSLGCVLGMDWHSSGITTTVCGALKVGLAPRARELGLWVCGGKGAVSRRTPGEIEEACATLGRDPAPLTSASRLSAKVDSAALQDGFQVYQHAFFFTADGEWAVVQQGMNEDARLARRYHWLGAGVRDFVCEPHAAIVSDHAPAPVLNMVAAEGDGARAATAAFAREHPLRTQAELRRLARLELPRRHAITAADLSSKHLSKVLLTTYERQPAGFAALLGLPGVGPKAVRALALVSELCYGAPASFRDPARFAFAHGGKDGTPYFVDRRSYDHTIGVLETAVRRARLGDHERTDALRRLERHLTRAGAATPDGSRPPP